MKLRLIPIWIGLVAALALCPVALFAQTTLKIMAANTTSGPHQSYDPGHGDRIFEGLKPDIVLVQEFNIGDNSETEIAAWVSETFGPDYHFYREPESGGIPNGVISRFPFLETGEWNDANMSNRDFAWARIDLPGDKEMWAISVHLKAGGNQGRRSLETQALRGFIRDQVPDADYLVLGGDFNTKRRNEPCIQNLSDLFVVSGPFPVDRNGNGNTNANRNKPYDWVLVEQELADLEIPVEVGDRVYEHGLVFDSRVFTPLDLVAPVEVGDSAAQNMQHMAVMRAFRIETGSNPNPNPDPNHEPDHDHDQARKRAIAALEATAAKLQAVLAEIRAEIARLKGQ